MPHNLWTKFGNSGRSDIAHRSQATYLINLASQKNCIKPLIPVHVQSSSKQHIVSSKSNKRICFYGKNHAGSPSQCTKLSFEMILFLQKLIRAALLYHVSKKSTWPVTEAKWSKGTNLVSFRAFRVSLFPIKSNWSIPFWYSKISTIVGTVDIATACNSWCYPGLGTLANSLGLKQWSLAQV